MISEITASQFGGPGPFVLGWAAIVLLWGAALATAAILATRRSRQLLMVVTLLSAGLAGGVVVLLAATPIVHRWPAALLPSVSYLYILGLVNHVDRTGAYPFFWSPGWVYDLSLMVGLLPLTGVLSLVGGLALRRPTYPASSLMIAWGAVVILLYGVAAGYTAVTAWNGIPV